MYQVFITHSAKKEAKKLPKQIRVAAFEAIEKLRKNPYLGEKLSGSLYFLYSLHFKSGGKDYRCAYSVDNQKKIIIIHFIQIRENFYQKLKRLFR